MRVMHRPTAGCGNSSQQRFSAAAKLIGSQFKELSPPQMGGGAAGRRGVAQEEEIVHAETWSWLLWQEICIPLPPESSTFASDFSARWRAAAAPD